LPGLSKEVREYRFGLVRGFMRAHGYDALAFTGSDWFEWISNYGLHDQAFERPFLLVVTANGASFALTSELSRNPIAAQAQRGAWWLDAVSHYAESPDKTRHRWVASQWHEMVTEALHGAGLDRARIATAARSEWLSEAASALPGLELTRANGELHNLRRVKHPEEIETMRRCAALTDWALKVYREELRPGRLLSEADHIVAARLVAEAARRFPDSRFAVRGLKTISGRLAAGADGHGRIDQVLERDSIAMTGLATRLEGLAMELARPWLVGAPDRRTLELLECARAAQDAGIEAVVAGRPISGIHEAAQRVFDAAGHGEQLRIRSGHGIGVIQHDFPVDVPFDGRPLLEREVYAVEPALYFPDFGVFRFADTVAVGATAPERLTTASKDRSALTLN